MFIYRLKNLFLSDEKLLTQEDCETIIRAKGYSECCGFSFVKQSYSTRTQIQVYDDKVWIKAYSASYGESDTIRFPFTKKQLISFIRSNAA
jgi:hypothetical protein